MDAISHACANERLPTPLVRLLGLALVANGVRLIARRPGRARGPAGIHTTASGRGIPSIRPLQGVLEVGLGIAMLGRAPIPPRTLYRFVAPVYDRLSPLWRDWLYRDASRALDEALRASCPPDGRVLDLGCGTGAVLERFLASGAAFSSYTGVDQSREMLDRSRTKFGAVPGVRFEQLDLRHDALPAGPFDLVTSAWALEHLPEPGGVVALAAERLRPGGRLVLFFEADGDSWRERALRRVWRFFGVRLVPERDYVTWPTGSIRRFVAAGPAVVLMILSRPQRPESVQDRQCHDRVRNYVRVAHWWQTRPPDGDSLC